jgi:class 3 adenylate cyclase
LSEGGAGARITSHAAPGEVLVSSTVRDLVVGSGQGLVDRGEQRLRGVPGAWRVFAAET